MGVILPVDDCDAVDVLLVVTLGVVVTLEEAGKGDVDSLCVKVGAAVLDTVAFEDLEDVMDMLPELLGDVVREGVLLVVLVMVAVAVLLGEAVTLLDAVGVTVLDAFTHVGAVVFHSQLNLSMAATVVEPTSPAAQLNLTILTSKGVATIVVGHVELGHCDCQSKLRTSCVAYCPPVTPVTPTHAVLCCIIWEISPMFKEYRPTSATPSRIVNSITPDLRL